MHQCTTCHRVFATSGSLNRHRQNHKKDQGYQCTVCQVAFYRHDLLMRHMKIHDQNTTADSQRERLRSRTACEPCRKARVKCSGSNPCSRCVRAHAECVFSSNGSRVSTDLRIRRAESSPSQWQLPRSESPSLPAKVDSSGEQPPPLGYSTSLSPTTVREEFTGSFMAQTNPPPETLAWPWVHENLFLQEDVFGAEWLEGAPLTNHNLIGTSANIQNLSQIASTQEPLGRSPQLSLPEEHLPMRIESPIRPLSLTQYHQSNSTCKRI